MSRAPTKPFDGHKLRTIRRQRGIMSQSAFGKLVGVSRQVVNYWERGVRKPNRDRIKRFADLLGCRLDELCAETTNK